MIHKEEHRWLIPKDVAGDDNLLIRICMAINDYVNYLNRRPTKVYLTNADEIKLYDVSVDYFIKKHVALPPCYDFRQALHFISNNRLAGLDIVWNAKESEIG